MWAGPKTPGRNAPRQFLLAALPSDVQSITSTADVPESTGWVSDGWTMALDRERETLDLLLEELDISGREQHAGETSEAYWVCQRRYPRYAFRADCIVRYFSPGHGKILSIAGRTRNLSRGGIGLLVRHVFAIGEPVELELQLPNQPKMFMAGLVQFIRYAGRGYHEFGMALKGAGAQPVFSHNPIVAIQTLDWLRSLAKPLKY